MSQQTFLLQCETKNNSQILWLSLMSTTYVQKIHIVIDFYPETSFTHSLPSFCVYIYYNSSFPSTQFATQQLLLLPNGSLNSCTMVSPFHSSIQGHLIIGSPILCSFSRQKWSFYLKDSASPDPFCYNTSGVVLHQPPAWSWWLLLIQSGSPKFHQSSPN